MPAVILRDRARRSRCTPLLLLGLAMQAVLGYPGESISVMEGAYQSLLQRLANADPHVDLRLASALWYANSISLLPTFASTVQTDFAAHISSADFTHPATAAAVTGVGMVETVVAVTPTVRADRPFLYAIRERSTGAVLFLGAFTHPPAGT